MSVFRASITQFVIELFSLLLQKKKQRKAGNPEIKFPRTCEVSGFEKAMHKKVSLNQNFS